MKNTNTKTKKTAKKKADKAKQTAKKAVEKKEAVAKKAVVKKEAVKKEAVEKKAVAKQQVKSDKKQVAKVGTTIKELKQVQAIKKLAISELDRKALSKSEKDADNILKYCFDKKYYSKIGANFTISVKNVVQAFTDFGYKSNLQAMSYLKHKAFMKFFTATYNISCTTGKFFKDDFFARIGQLSNDNGYLLIQPKTLTRYNKTVIDISDVKISISSFTR